MKAEGSFLSISLLLTHPISSRLWFGLVYVGVLGLPYVTIRYTLGNLFSLKSHDLVFTCFSIAAGVYLGRDGDRQAGRQRSECILRMGITYGSLVARAAIYRASGV